MRVNSLTLAELLQDTRDGDWGQGTASPGYKPYRVIRGTDFPSVRYGDLSGAPIRYISESSSERRTLQSNDILIETAGGSHERPTGRTLLLTERHLANADLPMTCASFCRFLRVDPLLADPCYVYWYLQYLYEKGEMWQHQVQHTGIARFQYTRFAASISIPLPDISQQRAIAHTLSTLDEKIELNHQTNETLETMARAIFKSWFVDFDPVRTKLEGSTPFGMNEETAAMFPSSFDNSAIGKIPTGWKVSSIGEIIDLSYGKALKEEARYPGSIPVYGSNGQVGWHNEALVKGPGIVVGRKGNPGIVTRVAKDFFPIDTTFYVVPKGSIHAMHYIYYALSLQNLASLAADSAVPGLNRNIAYMTGILVPSVEIANIFDKTVEPFFNRISMNHEESQTLITIRDALLPKLLSGEIRVKDAEKYAEALL